MTVAPVGAILLDRPAPERRDANAAQPPSDGIRRIVMVTGDRRQIAAPLGAMLGVDEVLAEQSPADKLAAVRAERERGRSVVMVGDGINDAPALAAADVGVAIGGHASGPRPPRRPTSSSPWTASIDWAMPA